MRKEVSEVSRAAEVIAKAIRMYGNARSKFGSYFSDHRLSNKMMHRLIAVVCCVLTFPAWASSLPSPLDSPNPEARIAITDLTTDFAAFWERTSTQPMDARVVGFKEDILVHFPEFYGIARFAGQRTQQEHDLVIRRAIEEFPAIRDRYLVRSERFHIALPDAISSFTKHFPDFRPGIPIYVIHSLGEADGGVRSLPSGDVLFFGIDGMVRLHEFTNDTPFFHHELFHTYHTPRLKECAGGAMWAYLWVEGLATYVSKVLNPDATDAELLLDIPVGSAARYRATLADSLAQFEQVADSTDRTVYRDLFTRAGKGQLPARRGYYLGYLVAEEAAKTRDVSALASLNCEQARETVQNAVQSLRSTIP